MRWNWIPRYAINARAFWTIWILEATLLLIYCAEFIHKRNWIKGKAKSLFSRLNWIPTQYNVFVYKTIYTIMWLNHEKGFIFHMWHAALLLRRSRHHRHRIEIWENNAITSPIRLFIIQWYSVFVAYPLRNLITFLILPWSKLFPRGDNIFVRIHFPNMGV